VRRALDDLGATVELIPAAPGLPDLVFTANAAVVLDGKALLSRFRYPQRQAEEKHSEAAFRSLQARGLIDAVRKLPDNLVLEGAGDCVFDRARDLFWMGYGPRSDAGALIAVEKTFGLDVIALELADPRFYHLDTALCPLPRGEVMYYPGAFTAAGRAMIEELVPAVQRIAISEDDACKLAANAVSIGDHLVMSACSSHLRATLEARGYRVVGTPLGSFLRSGGAAFCLTLRLDRQSARGRAMRLSPPVKATANGR
jgi:N-dimethylarginine dimethylaminohydrolase